MNKLVKINNQTALDKFYRKLFFYKSFIYPLYQSPLPVVFLLNKFAVIKKIKLHIMII